MVVVRQLVIDRAAKVVEDKNIATVVREPLLPNNAAIEFIECARNRRITIIADLPGSQ